MSVRQVQKVRVDAPWGGVNEAISKKLIPDNQLIASRNMMYRRGKLAPRPGYQQAQNSTENFVPIVVKATGSTQPRCPRWSSTLSKVVYINGSGVVKACDIDGDNESTLFTAALSTAQSPIVIDEGNYIYVVTGDRYVVRYTWTTWTIDGGWAGIDLGSNKVIDKMEKLGTDLYLSVDADEEIQKWNIAGTPASTVVAEAGAWGGSGSPEAFALDAAGDTLFVAQPGSPIYSIDISGSLPVTSLGTAIGSAYESARSSLVYDEANGRLYSYETSSDGGSLFSIKTDGTDKTVHLSGFGNNAVDCLGWLEFDTVSGDRTLLYGNYQSNISDHWIERINLDSPGQIISAHHISKSILGLESGDFINDITLLQVANGDELRNDLLAWFPTRQSVYPLVAGYRSPNGSLDPFITVILDRDTDADDGAPYDTGSGRCSYAWSGVGINTGAGGLLMASGKGLYVFNYTLSNTIYEVDHDGNAGNFTLTYGNYTTSSITDSSAVADIQETILTDIPTLKQVHVTKTGSGGSTVWNFEFNGLLAGQDITITKTDGTAAVVLTKIQNGGESEAANMVVRPAGLPRPTVDTSSSPSANITGEIAATAGSLSGIYNYRISYYSSFLDLESPPSDPFGENGVYTDTDSADSPSIKIQPSGLPTTLYFDQTTRPWPIIDKVRVYRRRWGNTLISASQPDGQGSVDNDWYFVAEVDIVHDNDDVTIFVDTGYEKTTIAAPTDNEYPPDNANFVAIANGYSVVCSITPGDHNLWYSGYGKVGGISDGELGYEYFGYGNYVELPQLVSSDTHFTGLRFFAGQTLVGSQQQCYSVNLDNADLAQGTARVLPGVRGFASHWCIAETDSIPGYPPVLLWSDDRGFVYAFDGVRAQLMNDQLRDTSERLVRQFWNDGTSFNPGFDTWYYSTMVVDPVRRIALLQSFDKTTFTDGPTNTKNTPLVLCYCLDNQQWYEWSLVTGGCFWQGREFSDTDTEGQIAIFFGGGSRLINQLTDGKMDGGTSFTYYLLSKHFMIDAIRRKLFYEASFAFERRSFGGSEHAPSIYVYADGSGSALAVTGGAHTITASSDDIQHIVAPMRCYADSIYFRIQGTINADDLSHLELLAMELDYETVGGIRR